MTRKDYNQAVEIVRKFANNGSKRGAADAYIVQTGFVLLFRNSNNFDETRFINVCMGVYGEKAKV